MIRTWDDFHGQFPLKAGFSERKHGNMSYPLAKNDALVHQNRLDFFIGEGLPPQRLVTFFTEHKDDIDVLGQFPPNLDAMKGQRFAVTDAIATDIPNSGVFLTFADCVPFIAYDERQHRMTFAHIGWRSMAMHFTQKVLRNMVEKQGSRKEDLIVLIGPSIKPKSYLFADPIQAQNPVWKPFLIPQVDGRMGIDLPGFCISECKEMGLSESQIFLEPMDTAADERQFSHYMGTEGGKADKQGRFLCYGFLQ
jgi:copper oxidase (laccase) domain-containing protein